MIESLRIGAPVYAAYGKRLGTLERIVVASEAGAEPRVVSLVVDPGFHGLGELLSPGALEKPRARTVPIEQMSSVDEDAIHLTTDEATFHALPLFERQEYVAAPTDQAGTRFRWGDLINYAAATFGLGAAPYTPSTETTVYNESAGSAELAERAPVWRSEPHELIGYIERALVEADTERVTGFIMRRARIDEEIVTLPASAITSIKDGVAHVALTDQALDHLEPYND
jgi:hypothetical protein